MKTAAAKQARVDQAIAAAALAYHYKKTGDRDALPEGDHALALTVSGEVAGRKLPRAKLEGVLQVAGDSTAAKSSGPPPELVLAAALDEIPPGRRERFVQQAIKRYQATGKPPKASDDMVAAAKQMARAMRNSETINKRGAVRFDPS